MPLTKKQADVLLKAGYAEQELDNFDKEAASGAIDLVKSNGWKKPTYAQLRAMAEKSLEQEVQANKKAVLEPRIDDCRLNDLFSKLGFAHQNAEQELRGELKEIAQDAQGLATRLGAVLIEYRELCAHGMWLQFLNVIGIPERNAQKYMLLARTRRAVKLTEGMERALARENVRLNTRMTAADAKIVEAAANLMQQKLAEMQAANPNPESDFDLPPNLSREQEEAIALEALRTVKQNPKANERIAGAQPGTKEPLSKYRVELRRLFMRMKRATEDLDRIRNFTNEVLDEIMRTVEGG